MTRAFEHDDKEQLDDFWLFGYGSLIWKPPPHFDNRIPGYITGYIRRFWQARCASKLLYGLEERLLLTICSEDHRGTPEAPGRVATLIKRSFWETLSDPHQNITSERVWGAAYHIIPSKVKEVKEYLDIREINGYSIQYTAFHPPDSRMKPIRCVVYIGLPNNPQFLGAQQPAAVAECIGRSRGPSGENPEYLFQLEESLNDLGEESGDAHVSDLASRVRKLGERSNVNGAPQASGRDGLKLTKVGSTDEQEEIEKEV